MKGGGGVALYIRKDIHCKLLSAKAFATDDILECVTVELSVTTYNPAESEGYCECGHRVKNSKIEAVV